MKEDSSGTGWLRLTWKNGCWTKVVVVVVVVVKTRSKDLHSSVTEEHRTPNSALRRRPVCLTHRLQLGCWSLFPRHPFHRDAAVQCSVDPESVTRENTPRTQFGLILSYAFATRQCRRMHHVFGLSVGRSFVLSSGQILLPWYLVNGLNNVDKTEQEYSITRYWWPG